jgi:flagellar export protein FliJ
MKAFRFTLEAVRILRQRQEQEAMENCARALLARQQAADLLEAIEQRIGREDEQMRRLLAKGCPAVEAAQAQDHHTWLAKKRREGLAALELAERRLHVASQAMLVARQQREMVDVYREKQQAVYQRLEWREEQKILDEFAMRRVGALPSARTDPDHD